MFGAAHATGVGCCFQNPENSTKSMSFLVKGSMRRSKLPVPREAIFKRAPQYWTPGTSCRGQASELMMWSPTICCVQRGSGKPVAWFQSKLKCLWTTVAKDVSPSQSPKAWDVQGQKIGVPAQQGATFLFLPRFCSNPAHSGLDGVQALLYSVSWFKC